MLSCALTFTECFIKNAGWTPALPGKSALFRFVELSDPAGEDAGAPRRTWIA
jgi:hypothetical protein